MKRTTRKNILCTFLIVVLLGTLMAASWFVSNPLNVSRLGDVPTPPGYQRIEAGDSYTTFIRNLPLKPRGSRVKLYKGGNAHMQWLAAAVIDWPVLSNSEQCADVTMRVRGEYLLSEKRYSDLCFTGVDGKEYAYTGGSSRDAFVKYMKNVYVKCNTASVYKETRQRSFKDVRPGDVLVYPSRRKGMSGHAILVADVARTKSGKTAILCVEGNTPAREAHIVRSLHPLHPCWHYIREGEDIWVSVFHFHPKELRHY